MPSSEPIVELPPQPIPTGESMPARKVIRSWLTHLMERSTSRALMLLVVDYMIFFALISAAVGLSNGWLRLLAGLVAGFWIGRFFILGHDACHQSYTPNRSLNRVLGRGIGSLSYAPRLTAARIWIGWHLARSRPLFIR